jgi:DNA repair protein RecO (recombination protein O)
MSARRHIRRKVQVGLGLKQSQAIVLKHFPWENSDKVVTFFTRDFGKMQGIAKGAQRPKSKFAGAFEAGNFIEMVFFEKENREWVIIDSADLLKSYTLRLKEYDQYLGLGLVMEVLVETLPFHEKQEALFRLVLMVLNEIQTIERLRLACLYFEVWYLKLSGLFPGSRRCNSCSRSLLEFENISFDRNIPGFFCQGCWNSRHIRISHDAFDGLRQIIENPLNLIADFKGSSTIQELASLLDPLIEKSFERKFETLQMLKH